MLSSSLDTLLKMFKATSPKKTIRKWLRNAVGMLGVFISLVALDEVPLPVPDDAEQALHVHPLQLHHLLVRPR